MWQKVFSCTGSISIGSMFALMLTFTATSAHAREEAAPLFVKVFAGKSLSSRRDFSKAVRRNLKSKTEIENVTVIPCDVGDYYGLGVVVSAPGKQYMNFETTAIWRDLDNYDVPRRSNRAHSLRKTEFGTRRFFFEIRAGSVDHDMTFIIHDGGTVYLRHKFEIRGCDAATQVDEQD